MAIGLKIAQLITEFVADTDKLEGGIGRAKQLTDGFGKSVQNAGKLVLGGLATGLAAGAAGAAAMGAGLMKLATDAAPLVNIKTAFDGIAESVGRTGDEMLAAFDKSSAGMVSHEDAMLSFNKAASLVSKDFAQQLPEAMGYLGKVAASTGQDMGFLLDSLVTGVGRVSPMILDNLGVQVSLTEAVAEWGKTHGATTTKVLDNTKAIAKGSANLSTLEQQLTLAKMRQSEFTDKTKESTRVQAQWKIDELTKKIADQRGELEQLSKSHGKTVTSTEDLTKSMTKQQQQEAVMELTMKKLAEATEAMPDITESAAAKMERFKTTLKNTKDQIGMALVPILGRLMDAFGPIVEKAVPQLIKLFETKLKPAIETIVGWVEKAIQFFGLFKDNLEKGVSPVNALRLAVLKTFGPEALKSVNKVITAFNDFKDKVMEVVDVVRPWVEKAWEWISQNIELEDVLIAVGIAIASVVVPALLSMAASVAPILLAIGAVIGIVALLRQVWEEHGDAIRAKVEEIWPQVRDWIVGAVETIREFVTNAIAVIRAWWEEHGEGIIAKAQAIGQGIRDFIGSAVEWIRGAVETALSAIRQFWETHKEKIMGVVESAWDFIQAVYERVTKIIQGIVAMFQGDSTGKWEKWKEVLKTIVDTLWKIIERLFENGLDQIKVLFDIFAAIFRGDWDKAWEGVKTLFENTWNTIKDIAGIVWGAISSAFDTFADTLRPITDRISAFFGGIRDAVDWISDAISTAVGWISGIIDWLNKLLGVELPGWAKGHSPPPLANWMNDIAEATENAANAIGQDLRVSLQAGSKLPTQLLNGRSGNNLTQDNRTTNYLQVTTTEQRPSLERNLFVLDALG